MGGPSSCLLLISVCAPMDPHPHAALWAERNERLWLDGVPGQGLKPDRARKLRQDGLSFHQGKMVPDADTRPTPKGHEGIAWPMRMPCGQRMGSASQLDPASAERKAPLLFAA